MIHHVSLGITDVERARSFYQPVMSVLGMRLMACDEESLDFGAARIIFSLEKPTNGKPASPGSGSHVAFEAESREMVKRFYETALAYGGQDAGAPGARPKYDNNYFAAFVLDPDGNKIEAVTFSAR